MTTSDRKNGTPEKIYLTRKSNGFLLPDKWYINFNPGDVEYINSELFPHWIKFSERKPEDRRWVVCLNSAGIFLMLTPLPKLNTLTTYWLEYLPDVPKELLTHTKPLNEEEHHIWCNFSKQSREGCKMCEGLFKDYPYNNLR